MTEAIHSIRIATHDDCDHIAQIHVASWQMAYKGLLPDGVLNSLNVVARTMSWQQILKNSSMPCFVLIHEGKIIGFSHLSASRDPDKSEGSGEVTAIYLHPDHWRQGHGSMLLEHSINALTDYGFTEITLWVLDGNIMARKFYEKAGFKVDGQSKMHEKSGLKEVRYKMDIGKR